MGAVKNWRKACWKSVAKNNDISKKRPNSLRSQCAPFCLPLHSPPERGLCPPFSHSVAIEELDFWLTHSLGNYNRRVCATAWTADEAVGDPWHLFLRPRCTLKTTCTFLIENNPVSYLLVTPTSRARFRQLGRLWKHHLYQADSRMWLVTLSNKQKQIVLKQGGHDSSVGVETRYGLHGPGIESLWGRGFPHPSRQTLGPNQPPIKWVSGLFPVVKVDEAWR